MERYSFRSYTLITTYKAGSLSRRSYLLCPHQACVYSFLPGELVLWISEFLQEKLVMTEIPRGQSRYLYPETRVGVPWS